VHFDKRVFVVHYAHNPKNGGVGGRSKNECLMSGLEKLANPRYSLHRWRYATRKQAVMYSFVSFGKKAGKTHPTP
jgi:hypothetical protein